MRKRFAFGVLLTAALGGCAGTDAYRSGLVTMVNPHAYESNVIRIDKILDRSSKGPAPIDLRRLSLSEAVDGGWSINALRKALPYAIGLVNTYSYQDLVDGFRRSGAEPWLPETGETSAKTYNWLINKYEERLKQEVGMSLKDSHRFYAKHGSPKYKIHKEIEDTIVRLGSDTTIGNLMWLYRVKNGKVPVGEVQVRLTAEISDVFQQPFRFADPWAHPNWYRDLFAGAVAYTILTRAAEDAVGMHKTKIAIVPNLDSRQKPERYMALREGRQIDGGDMDFETYFGEWSPALAGFGNFSRARIYRFNPNRLCSIFIHSDNEEVVRRLGLRPEMSRLFDFLPDFAVHKLDEKLNKSIGDRLFSDESKWAYDLILLPSEPRLLGLLRVAYDVNSNCTSLLMSRMSRDMVSMDIHGLGETDSYGQSFWLNNLEAMRGITSGPLQVHTRELTAEQYREVANFAASVVDYAVALKTGEVQ